MIHKTKTDGPPPAFRDITELPSIMSQSKWNIRWYDDVTLSGYDLGDVPKSEEFDKVARDTNIILAALRHDGFPRGPPPIYYREGLKRHALNHITYLVYSWLEARRYMRDVVCGRGNMPRANYTTRTLEWSDRYYHQKPYNGIPRQWHHEINPRTLGGTSYQVLHKTNLMIPIMISVANELHENPTHNPYLYMRQLFEAIQAGHDIPPPPREALPLARQATGNPW